MNGWKVREELEDTNSRKKNFKTCVVCGKSFPCPPSSKKITCSDKCRSVRSSRVKTGKARSEEFRKKISLAASGRDMSGIQGLAIAAALESPLAGRFDTNVNAMEWHIVSPWGKHYRFRSLREWVRKNGERMFGCDPDNDAEVARICRGFSNAKRAYLNKVSGGGCCTYKDWRVIPTDDDVEKMKRQRG